jgi:indolepyruvate ferredoxin oxidoreductase beta subunit
VSDININTKSILLVGVGGQGTILASKIFSEAFMQLGYDVKMSEIHGMSQRGGSVSTQIRYGSKVYSPIISPGEADVIVAFEKMEALRWIDYLRPGGKIVINDFEIPSVPILMGQAEYPEGIIAYLSEIADVNALNAAKIASDLGNDKAMNIVLLGSAVKALKAIGSTELDSVDWESIIRASVKPQFAELNVKAFAAGYEA